MSIAPWDVINYCDELLAAPKTPPKNYWANTSGNDLIRRMLKNANLTTKNEVEELLNGGQVTKRIKQELTYREIDDSIENVWSVLYATGYLTGMHVEQEDADIFRLWIPNGEIRNCFTNWWKDWFREATRSDTSRISRFCAAFPAVTPIQSRRCSAITCGDSNQCQGYGSAQEYEGKFLPWDAAGAFAEPGQLAGKIQCRDRGRLQ